MLNRQSAAVILNNVAVLRPANKHAPLWDVQRLNRRLSAQGGFARNQLLSFASSASFAVKI
jgi:hypothetical protein